MQGRRGLAPVGILGLVALMIALVAGSFFYIAARREAEAQAAELATLEAIASARAAEAATLLGDEEAQRERELYLSDTRIRDLLGGCSQEHFYDRDTSDMIPVLVEKLVTGYTEPLQRSKEELAKLGPEAIEGVRRLADKWYTDATGASYVQNALDVAVMSDEPLAREIVLRFLEHPRDSLRRMAMRGMSKRHATPADFDRLWVQLESDTVNNQELVIPGMHKADPVRAEELFLDWVENNSHDHLWSFFAPFIAASERPETIARAVEIQAQTPAGIRPFLAASAAKSGDVAAQAALMAVLANGAELERERATFACAQARLEGLLLMSLVKDESAAVRIAAATGLAALEPTSEIDARLAEALGDSDESVRKIALEALVRRGNTAGANYALALLEGDGESRNEALSVLRERMKVDEDLADRARGRMIVIDQTRKHLPLEERFAVLKSMGSIPGKETAQYLRQVALAHPGALTNRRTHQMLIVHASNSGETGRAWLFEQLKTETDPLNRVDLLWASTCFRTDAARERLQEFLSDEDLSPYEILFASDQLARLGPAQDVAPMLKRICYRITQNDVRNGMRCLLWKWY